MVKASLPSCRRAPWGRQRRLGSRRMGHGGRHWLGQRQASHPGPAGKACRKRGGKGKSLASARCQIEELKEKAKLWPLQRLAWLRCFERMISSGSASTAQKPPVLAQVGKTLKTLKGLKPEALYPEALTRDTIPLNPNNPKP